MTKADEELYRLLYGNAVKENGEAAANAAIKRTAENTAALSSPSSSQSKPSTASGVGTMNTDILGARSGKKTEESSFGDKTKAAVDDLFDGRDERDPITVLSEMYGKAKNKIEAKGREKEEHDSRVRYDYANRDDTVTDITTRVNSERVLAENAETEEEYQKHVDNYNQAVADLTSYYDREAQTADIQLKEAEGNRSQTDILAARAGGADLTDELNTWEQAHANQYLWHQNMDMPALEEQVKATPEYKEALANGDRGKVWQNGGLISTVLGTPDTAIDNMARNSLLTDEQAAVLSVLQATDKDKAKDYEDYLLRNVNQQLADLETQNLTENKGLRPLAYLAGGYTAADSLLATGGENIRRTLGGEYRPVDTNSQAFKGARMQGTAEDLMLSGIDSEFGRLAASAGLSIADIATKMPLGGIALAAMGTEVAGRTAYDSLARGAHPQNAVMNGLAAGAAEVLAEYLPIKNMFKLLSAGKGKIGRLASGVMRGSGKAAARTPLISAQGIKALGKQAGLEAGEEFFTEYAQTLSDIATMGELSNYNLAREAYIASGMSEEEATRQANIDFFVVQPIQAAFAGAIAGGFLGAGSIAISSGIIDRTASKAAKGNGWNMNPMTGMKAYWQTEPARQAAAAERDAERTAEAWNEYTAANNETYPAELAEQEQQANLLATEERRRSVERQRAQVEEKEALEQARADKARADELIAQRERMTDSAMRRNVKKRADRLYGRANPILERAQEAEEKRAENAAFPSVQAELDQLEAEREEQRRYWASMGMEDVFEEEINPVFDQRREEIIAKANAEFTGVPLSKTETQPEQGNEPPEVDLEDESNYGVKNGVNTAANQNVETGPQEEYNENVEEENINERNGRAEQNGSGGQVVQEDNRGLPQGRNVGRADTGANKRLRDVVSAELKEALDRKSVPDSGLEDYSDRYNDFADALSSHVVTHPFGAFVSTHTPEELAEDGARVMMNPDGKSGIAVFSDNNIGAVFNNSDRKGTLRDMLPTALEMGGNKLDNFDGALSKFYAQFGFVPVAKVAFNDEYAPEGWNYERDGRPDVIFWMHNGDSPSVVVDKQGTYDTPDTSNLPLFTDYDAAYEYRDMLLEKQNQSSQAGPTEPASSGPVLTDRRPIGVKGDTRTPRGEGEETVNEFFKEGGSGERAVGLGTITEDVENAAKDLAGPRVRVTDKQIEERAEKALKKHGAEKIYNYLMSRTKDPGSYTEVEQMAAAKLAATFAEEAQNPEHSEKTRQDYFRAATNMWAESAKNASNVGRMLRLTQQIIKQVPGCYVLRANKELQDEGFEGLTDEEIKTVNALQAMAQEGTSEAGNPKNIKEIWAMKDGPAKDTALAEATKDMQPWYANKIKKLVRKASTDANLEDQLVMLCEYMLATKKNPSLMDKWRALQRINMLLNMKTQLRNFGGNLLHTGAEDVSNNLAVVIDSIISGRTGRRTVGHSELGAMVEGTRAGAQEVIDAARAGTASQIGDKYTDTHNPGVNFTGNKVASKALRALDNATSIALAFGDRIFFSKREADVRAQLVKLRDQGKLKINGKDISDEDIAEIAEKEATQVTFQDNNAFSRAVVKARNAAHVKRMSIAKDLRLAKRDSKDKGEIARLRQEYALATLMDWTETVIMPFAKTPANLLVAGLRYSPLGLGKGIGNLYNVMRSGEDALPAAQREAAMAIARGIVGSSLMAIGSGMGALGLASGEDKEDKAYREANGIPDNAYRLGEHKWIDLSSLGPIPVAINLGASIYNELKNAGSTSSAALSAVKTLLAANLNDMTGDTLWDGVTDTVSALTSGDAAKAVEELALDAGAQLVPLSSFLRAIENTIDPYSRETSASSTVGQSFNQTISGIPGLASLLPKKKDVLTGDDKFRYPLKGTETWQLAGRLINAMVNPGNIYEDYTGDPVMEELNRLYRQTGENKYIDKAPYKVTIEGEEHKLVGEDRTMFQKTASEDAYELLSEMMNSNIYKQASDAQKSYLAGKAMDYGKQDAKEQFARNNDLPEPESANDYDYIHKINQAAFSSGINAGEAMIYKKLFDDTDNDYELMQLMDDLNLPPEITYNDLLMPTHWIPQTSLIPKAEEAYNNAGIDIGTYGVYKSALNELHERRGDSSSTKAQRWDIANNIPGLTNAQRSYLVKNSR